MTFAVHSCQQNSVCVPFSFARTQLFPTAEEEVKGIAVNPAFAEELLVFQELGEEAEAHGNMLKLTIRPYACGADEKQFVELATELVFGAKYPF